MKLYISAASSKNSYTLAKGIYVPKYNMPEDLASEYDDYFVHGANVYGYLFFTEAKYFPATQTLEGKLMNHQELAAKYKLAAIPSNKLTYFRVDVANDGKGTELTTSGMSNNSLNKYLSDLFKVSHIPDTSEADWESIDTPEFKEAYRVAAANCEEYIESIRNESELDNYRSEYFAFCFAIIDPETHLGIVSKSSNGILFASHTYTQYRRAVDKMAKQLGKHYTDLLFKTLYYGDGYGYDYSGTQIKLFREAKNLCYYIYNNHMDDELEVDIDNYTKDCNIRSEITGRNVGIIVDPTCLDVDIEEIVPNLIYHVTIPEDTKRTKEIDNIIYSLLSNKEE